MVMGPKGISVQDDGGDLHTIGHGGVGGEVRKIFIKSKASVEDALQQQC